MTYLLPIAIVTLCLLIHISIISLIIPIALGYLLFLYSLKELPQSKLKNLFYTLGLIGFIISFLPTTTIIIHDIIMIIIMISLSLKMDNKSLYVLPSTILGLIAFCCGQFFYIATENLYMVENINIWIASLIILIICLYHFYKYMTLYMLDLESFSIHKRKKDISTFLKVTLCMVTLLSGLFMFQEYYFAINQQIYKSIYYTVEDNADGIHYLYPLNSTLSTSGYSQVNDTYGFLKLPASFYSYYEISLTYGTTSHPEIEVYRFEKKVDAPKTMEEDFFSLETYYDKTMYTTFPKVETHFNLDEPLQLTIIAYEDDHSKEITLNLNRNNGLFTGRSLLTKAYFSYSGSTRISNTIYVNYSIYLSSIIDKCATAEYELYAISKNDQSETLINIGYEDYFENNNSLQRYSFYNDEITFDFENYDYQLNIRLINVHEETLYQTKVVLEQ